jgi:hypothetical protein
LTDFSDKIMRKNMKARRAQGRYSAMPPSTRCAWPVM